MDRNANALRRRTAGVRTHNLATIRETAQKYPFLSEATMRDWVYHSRERLSARGETIKPTRFARCIVRLGEGPRAKVLIDHDELDALIEEGRVAPSASRDEAEAA